MRILLAGLVAVMMTACGSGNKSDEQAFVEALDGADLDRRVISQEMNDILYRIPSPLEISVMLKDGGNRYDGAILNPVSNAGRYNTNYEKALNLGIFGTDLGYTNIYQQRQDGIGYMTAITGLAKDLNIGQFFELETIGRLVSNSENLDSLMLITTQNFNDINQYLLAEDRGHLTVLLLAGGWIEALHITCHVARDKPDNKQLHETIGAQKVILDNILQLLAFFKDADESMVDLEKDLLQLKEAFDAITITTEYKPSTYEVVDGVMVVRDNSSSAIQVTAADIDNIRSRTERIRNKIIS